MYQEVAWRIRNLDKRQVDVMFPHSVTIFCKTESNHVASWQIYQLKGVRYEDTKGSKRSSPGDTSSVNAVVLIPYDTWISKGDKLVFGAGEFSQPPKGALTVTEVSVVRVGRKIHHLEVNCE